MTRYDIGKYYDEHMNEIDTKDLITTHLHIPSTQFENQWTGGEDGIPSRHTGSFIIPKTIEAQVFIQGFDYLDYQLIRDYLYGIFGFNKPFYIVDKVQPGKRHKVILESGFMPKRLSNTSGTATIPFVTCDSHYAESIGTTQDIEQNGINAEDELWGFGMGLIVDDDSLIYTYTAVAGQTFKIYNAGNVSVHPFEQELKITIDQIQGSTVFLELWNRTTNQRFRVTRSASGTIVLDGPNITHNGFPYLRNTNMNFIELVPGWNEFSIVGADSARVAFDFRFYYH